MEKKVLDGVLPASLDLATNVVVTDPLPTPGNLGNWQVTSVTSTGTITPAVSNASCSISGGNALTCNLGSMATGATATVRVTTSKQGGADLTACTSNNNRVDNIAKVTSTGLTDKTDPGFWVCQPPPPPSITIVKTPDGGPVGNGTFNVGDQIFFDVKVTSNGPGTATNVVVTDPLPTPGNLGSWLVTSVTPTGTIIPAVSNASCSISGGNALTCNLGSMAAGATATVRVTTSKQGGADLTACTSNNNRVDNTAKVTSTGLADQTDTGYWVCTPPPPSCALTLSKTCELPAPPPTTLATCSGKLTEYTVIWNGSGPITISGQTQGTNDAPGGVVVPGQRVIFKGPFTVNDQYITIAGAVSGRSTFHVSCSDKDMDGITSTNLEQQQLPGRAGDCGKTEGNGKGLTGLINQWLLDGLVDGAGKRLQCTVPSTTPTSSCTFQKPAPVSCGTGGKTKPSTLTFKYTGGGCSVQSNQQAAGKTSCSGQIDPTKAVTVNYPGGSAVVQPGGTFTMPRTQTQSVITLTNSGGTETDSIHTSCSQPLITGDVYFSLTLVAEDGIGIAKDVLYKYKVTNTGATAINGISVTDNKLGTIQPSPFNLAAGANTTLSATAAITATTTNIATVADVGGSCVAGVVTSSATVTVTP